MKKILFLLLMLGMHLQSQTSLYDFEMKSIDGKPIRFSDFKGKKILLVNVASYCGFTPQYSDLEKLHREYGNKVVVIGVPCNQFGNQEPGSAEEIKSFCKKNYDVSFTLTEKTDVKGEKAHAVYRWLADKNKNGVLENTPSWNFCKFLFDEKGKPVAFFKSNVSPLSEEILKFIK